MASMAKMDDFESLGSKEMKWFDFVEIPQVVQGNGML
jgi:hypothetical protein